MISVLRNQRIHRKNQWGFIKILQDLKSLLILSSVVLMIIYFFTSGKMVPSLEVLSDLVTKHIEIRLLHAKEPGQAIIISKIKNSEDDPPNN